MKNYKLIKSFITNEQTDVIIRLPDNSFIPTDNANTDYQEYLVWVAEGNKAEEADEI